MKKYMALHLFVGLMFFTACEKDPDVDKLDDDYLVLTNYDSNTDFARFSTFHVIDSILIIENRTKPEYWKNENSRLIVTAFNSNFISRGYTPTEKGEDADLVLQLSYVNTTYYFSNTAGPWWYNYPGYWNWGAGWYYPFTFYYSYSTGSIIGELVDRKDIRSDRLYTIVWNTYITGLLNGSNLSYYRTMGAIDQAFAQSPYLKK